MYTQLMLHAEPISQCERRDTPMFSRPELRAGRLCLLEHCTVSRKSVSTLSVWADAHEILFRRNLVTSRFPTAGDTSMADARISEVGATLEISDAVS
jgi:hypothetical protein